MLGVQIAFLWRLSITSRTQKSLNMGCGTAAETNHVGVPLFLSHPVSANAGPSTPKSTGFDARPGPSSAFNTYICSRTACAMALATALSIFFRHSRWIIPAARARTASRTNVAHSAAWPEGAGWSPGGDARTLGAMKPATAAMMSGERNQRSRRTVSGMALGSTAPGGAFRA